MLKLDGPWSGVEEFMLMWEFMLVIRTADAGVGPHAGLNHTKTAKTGPAFVGIVSHVQAANGVIWIESSQHCGTSLLQARLTAESKLPRLFGIWTQ